MTKRGLNQYYEVISAYFVLKAVHVTTQHQENISVFAVACVQTSPPPSGKNVHRLFLPQGCYYAG